VSPAYVKKPERSVAIALVMTLCLLVYRLAEHRLRAQLATATPAPASHAFPATLSDASTPIPALSATASPSTTPPTPGWIAPE
jgi:hypothetical protein